MELSYNISWSTSIIEKLKLNGARLFCICPGARNAALIDVLSRQTDLEVRTFVDERSAAFFALGRSLEYNEPSVVCTTSGTAVAELLPATIEAHYVNARLVLLTADRPQRFRERGAPQAIEQLSFLEAHVSAQWDLVEGNKDFYLADMGPTHINMCFEEPILGDPKPQAIGVVEPKQKERPLVVIGCLNKNERLTVKNFLQTNKGYFLAESHSGLRGFSLPSGMKELPYQLIQSKNFRQWFDSIIRIGGVPTVRLWRDLEDTLIDIPVTSYSSIARSGLGREGTAPAPLEELKNLQLVEPSVQPDLDEVLKSWHLRRENIFLNLPKSELSMVGQLSKIIPTKSKLFLGNSLPIREWDLMAQLRVDLDIRTQRGVNGIDGLISTFLGRLDSAVENVLLLGDLSTIYDANAFWVWRETLKNPRGLRVKLIIINNGGGRIFRRLFENPVLQSSHEFNFSDFSEMFGWKYFHWSHSSQMNWQRLPTQCLVELQPNLEESDRAWEMLYE